jgi:hypothetical protein
VCARALKVRYVRRIAAADFKCIRKTAGYIFYIVLYTTCIERDTFEQIIKQTQRLQKK